MNGWPINGMREHDAPREDHRVSAQTRHQGHQALPVRPRPGQCAGPARRHIHHPGGAAGNRSIPIQRIRKTAGDEMEIALDLSSRWNLPCSMQIAHSLEPYGIMYLEDAMLPDNLEAYASLARETSIPICISERLATRFRFREMFEQRAVDVVMWDVDLVRRHLGGEEDFRHGGHLQDSHLPAHRGRTHPVVRLHPHGDLAHQFLHHGERVPPVQRRVSALHQGRAGPGERVRHRARSARPRASSSAKRRSETATRSSRPSRHNSSESL